MAARKGDKHHYAADQTKNPIYGYRLGRRGMLCPNSKPVLCPLGAFASLALAAEATNRPRQTAQYLAKRGVEGYDTGWAWL